MRKTTVMVYLLKGNSIVQVQSEQNTFLWKHLWALENGKKKLVEPTQTRTHAVYCAVIFTLTQTYPGKADNFTAASPPRKKTTTTDTMGQFNFVHIALIHNRGTFYPIFYREPMQRLRNVTSLHVTTHPCGFDFVQRCFHCSCFAPLPCHCLFYN